MENKDYSAKELNEKSRQLGEHRLENCPGWRHAHPDCPTSGGTGDMDDYDASYDVDAALLAKDDHLIF